MNAAALWDRRWLRTLTGRPRAGDANAGPRADAAAWLVQLRWFAVAGQLLTIAAVCWGVDVALPPGPLLWVVAVTAATNVALAAWLATHPEHGPPGEPDRRVVPVLGAAMLLDVALLTALLYFSGGPNNPFYGFYFVNLALAAALLPTRWAWACDAAAVLGYLLITCDHVPLPHVPQRPTSAGGQRGRHAADGRPGRRLPDVQRDGRVLRHAAPGPAPPAGRPGPGGRVGAGPRAEAGGPRHARRRGRPTN